MKPAQVHQDVDRTIEECRSALSDVSDAARLDFVMPVLLGGDDLVCVTRSNAIFVALTQGLVGRAAIDAAMQREGADSALDPFAPVVAAYDLPGEIQVQRVAQRDGTHLWAVRGFGGNCLRKDAVWSYEPTPSGRTDEWIKQHRFDSAKQAIDTVRIAAEKYSAAGPAYAAGTSDLIANA